MKNIDIDFYDEFDGEVEIIFSIITNNYTKRLRIWSGYFDTIMMKIEPLKDDGWTSLSYYYHLMIGWDIEDNWQIPNLEEALLQLQSIEIEPNYSDKYIYYNAEFRILAEIISILSEAIHEKVSVYIHRH